jgi:hypothetical protein
MPDLLTNRYGHCRHLMYYLTALISQNVLATAVAGKNQIIEEASSLILKSQGELGTVVLEGQQEVDTYFSSMIRATLQALKV